MNIKRLYTALLTSAIVIASYATDFDCRFNYANGMYNGKSEEEMISINTNKFQNNTWATLWEKKKTELNDAFITSFCQKGKSYNLCAGVSQETSYKIEVNVICIDPDGEIEAHILAYQNDATSGEFSIYLDKSFSADGGKDATYTNLSTKGFSRLGAMIASELGSILARDQRTIEREKRQIAKETKRNAENPTNPDDIYISMDRKEITYLKPLYPIIIERDIETTKGETILQCYKELKETAARYGATTVLIKKLTQTSKRITIDAYSYKRRD